MRTGSSGVDFGEQVRHEIPELLPMADKICIELRDQWLGAIKHTRSKGLNALADAGIRHHKIVMRAYDSSMNTLCISSPGEWI